MRRYVIGSVCGALALTATVAAQNPQPERPQPQAPAAQAQPRPQERAQTVTVEGCLVREADVPGRKPNIAERAGITEDYILTSTKMVKGSAPAPGAQARPGEKPTGTSGTQAGMYEVTGIDDTQLKQHVGQRVQIDGMFANVDRAAATPEKGTPADDLVEIRGTMIRKVAGECAAAK